MTLRAIVRRMRAPASKDTLDLAVLATVDVSSEQAAFPIDNVFDGQSGPGGSCWIAGTSGEQVILVRFHGTHDLDTILVESEERGDTRTQRIDLEVWSEHGRVELTPRTFSFTPYGPSFHKAIWSLGARGVTSFRLRVTPDPADKRASLTSIAAR
jgi:hypothetical protein